MHRLSFRYTPFRLVTWCATKMPRGRGGRVGLKKDPLPPPPTAIRACPCLLIATWVVPRLLEGGGKILLRIERERERAREVRIAMRKLSYMCPLFCLWPFSLLLSRETRSCTTACTLTPTIKSIRRYEEKRTRGRKYRELEWEMRRKRFVPVFVYTEEWMQWRGQCVPWFDTVKGHWHAYPSFFLSPRFISTWPSLRFWWLISMLYVWERGRRGKKKWAKERMHQGINEHFLMFGLLPLLLCPGGCGSYAYSVLFSRCIYEI